MQKTSEASKEDKGNFSGILKEFYKGQMPIEVVLEHRFFNKRLEILTRAHTKNLADADDLASVVREKVWRKLPGFKPDYTYDGNFGNFFAWLKKIVLRSFYDTLRNGPSYIDERPEDLNSGEPINNPEAEFLLNVCIDSLPERIRLALQYYVLEGYTTRETAKKLKLAGYQCSHVTVVNWLREGLLPYFQDAPGPEIATVKRKTSKSPREKSEEQSSSTKKDRTKNAAKRVVGKTVKS